jgi:hypothetical protein
MSSYRNAPRPLYWQLIRHEGTAFPRAAGALAGGAFSVGGRGRVNYPPALVKV